MLCRGSSRLIGMPFEYDFLFPDGRHIHLDRIFLYSNHTQGGYHRLYHKFYWHHTGWQLYLSRSFLWAGKIIDSARTPRRLPCLGNIHQRRQDEIVGLRSMQLLHQLLAARDEECLLPPLRLSVSSSSMLLSSPDNASSSSFPSLILSATKLHCSDLPHGSGAEGWDQKKRQPAN